MNIYNDPSNAKTIIGLSGLRRLPWEKSANIDYPEDWGLAISSNLKQSDIPKEFLQIFVRFYKLGWIHEHGDKCIFMSSLLRRILRLHGFPAYMREVVMNYEHPTRNWQAVVGGHRDYVPNTGEIDIHVVVACQGIILDFAQYSAIHKLFGNLSPLAFIAEDDPKYHLEPQNFGFHGTAYWTPSKPAHPMLKHIRWDIREHVLHLTKEYFSIYQY